MPRGRQIPAARTLAYTRGFQQQAHARDLGSELSRGAGSAGSGPSLIPALSDWGPTLLCCEAEPRGGAGGRETSPGTAQQRGAQASSGSGQAWIRFCRQRAISAQLGRLSSSMAAVQATAWDLSEGEAIACYGRLGDSLPSYTWRLCWPRTKGKCRRILKSVRKQKDPDR
jgi:hypothetical protein